MKKKNNIRIYYIKYQDTIELTKGYIGIFLMTYIGCKWGFC